MLLSSHSDLWQKLGDSKGIKRVEQPTTGKIHLTLEADTDADEAINEVVEAVVKLGIRIQGVSLLSPSLDEIYLNYVQEGES